MPQVFIQQQGQSNAEAVSLAMAGALATAAEVLVYSRVQTPAIYRTLPQPIYSVAADGTVTDLGGGFVPTIVAGNVLDLDGDLDVTEGAGGVSLWVDQAAGGAGNVTQASAANRPGYTVVDANFNGHGSVDHTTVDRLDAAAGVTLDVPAGGHLYHYFVANIPVYIGPGQPFVFQKGYTIRHLIGDRLRCTATNDVAGTFSVDSEVIGGGTHVFRVHYDDAGLVGVRIDAGVENETNDGNGIAVSATFWRIGDFAASVVGDFGRVLVYSRATVISAADDSNLLTQLAAIYGVTL